MNIRPLTDFEIGMVDELAKIDECSRTSEIDKLARESLWPRCADLVAKAATESIRELQQTLIASTP